ncbi:MAG: hypothetical protein HY727_02795 [Candidatus Rokubacteria bacterium]|nr:hypothetical protein [Candidatus Rokubacteria bacterium]
MRPARAWIALFAAIALSGCAAFACRLETIVVVDRESRVRLQSRIRGIRVDPLGRVNEDREDVIVHEYWVKDASGRWHKVGEASWRDAALGAELEVCR